jgi:UDP-N-acetyl-D-glucosamine dehydrogenase
MFASELGIDVHEAIDAASSKPFGYMRFTPGPGVGGHCLPIDPSYLSWRVKRTLGQSFRFVELANDINDHIPDYVVRRLLLALNRSRQAVNGTRSSCWVLPTSPTRATPVSLPPWWSPSGCCSSAPRSAPWMPTSAKAGSTRIVRAEATAEEFAAADAVVLLTDHDDVDYELLGAQAKYVFDVRHRLMPAPNVEHL